MNLDQTIASVISGSIDGAVSVIRVSGPNTISLFNQLLSKPPSHWQANSIELYNIGNPKLDQALVAFFKGPKSYTGEDVIEIYTHASSYIVNQILNQLYKLGAVAAQAGEFTMRAYLNGKLDLAQAEAVADMIAAESEAEHQMAFNQLKGNISKELQVLKNELIDFAGLIELELDFGEEDVEFASRPLLLAKLTETQNVVQTLANSFAQGNALKQGIPIAIVGAPNAGKSTLLNALINEERAIVTEIEGTTRDTIEEQLIIDGVKFKIIDTAGLRETTDTVERIGIERSFSAIAKAQLLFYLYDPQSTTPQQLEKQLELIETKPNQQLIVVANKTDKMQAHQPHHLSISAKHANIGPLINLLKENAVNLKTPGITISNQRHFQALSNADMHLHQTLQMLQSGMGGELVAIHLKEAIHALASIVGQVDSDEILGAIFSKFCIGK